MNDGTPSWLKKVQEESDKVPMWVLQVLEHPKFAAIQKRENTWELFTVDEDLIEATDLRELCQKFSAHFGGM
jgi:hypothetical protein